MFQYRALLISNLIIALICLAYALPLDLGLLLGSAIVTFWALFAAIVAASVFAIFFGTTYQVLRGAIGRVLMRAALIGNGVLLGFYVLAIAYCVVRRPLNELTTLWPLTILALMLWKNILSLRFIDYISERQSPAIENIDIAPRPQAVQSD